jgi:hypothetical protein
LTQGRISTRSGLVERRKRVFVEDGLGGLLRSNTPLAQGLDLASGVTARTRIRRVRVRTPKPTADMGIERCRCGPEALARCRSVDQLSGVHMLIL